MKKILEKDIQRTICDWLALKKYFFWRQNVIPVYSEGKFRALPKYSLRGAPDIMIVSGGKFIGLEVKNVKRPTPHTEDQQSFGNNLHNNGGYYFVVNSLEQAQAALDKAGVLC